MGADILNSLSLLALLAQELQEPLTFVKVYCPCYPKLATNSLFFIIMNLVNLGELCIHLTMKGKIHRLI